MKQVVQSLKSGGVSVVDVPAPALRAGGALVAVRASLISPGTERAKIELGEKSLLGKARARPELARQVIEKARRDGLRETYETVRQRLEAPGPLGYSASGTVLAVGAGCPGLKPGDLVACAGGGYASHAEVNFVPHNLLARAPEGVTAEAAAYATIGAIALHGVRQADLRLGERVTVIGLGLVGLLAVQLARAAGARVLAVDVDPAACALASQLGAELAVPRGGAVEAAATAFSDGAGVDAVIVCASTPSSDPLELAATIARDRARVIVVGAVGMTIPREPYYHKELELRLSRSYGPGRYDPAYEEHGQDYPIGYVRWTEQRNLAEFMRLIAAGSVDVETLTTHRFPVERAEEAYALVAGKVEGATKPVGVVLLYEGDPEAALGRPIELRPAPAPERPGVGIGLLGAGSFATRVLLPALKADDRVELTGVATAGGLSARNAADQFGFGYAAPGAAALFADPAIGAVVIATRHDSHAALAAAGLRAGKSVFCEKPLATSAEGLEEVAAAYAEDPGVLFVGFNRRYSPLSKELRNFLPPGVPRAITCRVNAGPLAADHWTNDPASGGGRIVGELCHFLDLACFFAEEQPVRVTAEALGGAAPAALAESVVVQVLFACGSVASIQYLANGDTAVAKERVEVFCGGAIGTIDDFRVLELVRGGKRTRRRGRRQEKGHAEEVRAFVDAACGAVDDSATEAAFWSSALTLGVVDSLCLGGPVSISLPGSLTRRDAAADPAG